MHTNTRAEAPQDIVQTTSRSLLARGWALTTMPSVMYAYTDPYTFSRKTHKHPPTPTHSHAPARSVHDRALSPRAHALSWAP